MSIKYQVIAVKFNNPITEEEIHSFISTNDKLVYNKKSMFQSPTHTIIFQKDKYSDVNLDECLY
jgi:hypothetical protein